MFFTLFDDLLHVALKEEKTWRVIIIHCLLYINNQNQIN
jgi:hypothetical protein